MMISLDFAPEDKRKQGSCKDEQHPDGEWEGGKEAIGVDNVRWAVP